MPAPTVPANQVEDVLNDPVYERIVQEALGAATRIDVAHTGIPEGVHFISDGVSIISNTGITLGLDANTIYNGLINQVDQLFIFCCHGASTEELGTLRAQLQQGENIVVTRFPVVVLEVQRNGSPVVLTVHPYETTGIEDVERSRAVLQREIEAAEAGNYNTVFVNFQVSVTALPPGTRIQSPTT